MKLSKGYSGLYVLLGLGSIAILSVFVLSKTTRSFSSQSSEKVAGVESQTGAYICDPYSAYVPGENDGSIRLKSIGGSPQWDPLTFFNRGTVTLTLYAKKEGWKFPEDYDNGQMTMLTDDGRTWKSRNLWKEVGENTYEWVQDLTGTSIVAFYIDNGRVDTWVPSCPWVFDYERNGVRLVEEVSTPTVSMFINKITNSKDQLYKRYHLLTQINQFWVYFPWETRISLNSNCAKRTGSSGFSKVVPVFQDGLDVSVRVKASEVKNPRAQIPYRIIRVSDNRVMWSGTVVGPVCK